MKIQQIIQESRVHSVLDEMVDDGTIDSYTINTDGSVNISGDLTIQGTYEDLGLPRINYIDGSFDWYFIPLDYDIVPYLPKAIRGDCEIPLNGQTVKSSMLPKCSGLKVSGSGAKVIFDDDNLSNCNSISLGPDGAFIGGFEHLPRTWNMSNIAIESDDLSGLPSKIKCNTFELVVAKPEALKGIHKVVKSIECGSYAQIEFPAGTPLLGLLRVLNAPTIMTNITSESRNGPRNQQLRRLINSLKQSDNDTFGMQEQLIDAGFNEFAKQ